MANPREGGLAYPNGPRVVACGCERGERVDPIRGQPPDLLASDVGDEAEVVVLGALHVAVLGPATNIAVCYLVWVGPVDSAREPCLEPALHPAVVRGVFGEPETLALVRAEQHVDSPRRDALHTLHELRVQAQLHQEVGLDAPRELRVCGLVGPAVPV